MSFDDKPFIAFQRVPTQLPIIAVDIGYSSNARSCGLAWSGHETPCCFRFGEAVSEVAKLCGRFTSPILVLEAALSTYHLPNGNPHLRGAFEKGRGWYWGPGAVSLIAATRFLQMLAAQLSPCKPLFVAEAFLSNKLKRTKHTEDASRIVEEFWKCDPEVLEAAAESISNFIDGVPSVRIFGTR